MEGRRGPIEALAVKNKLRNPRRPPLKCKSPSTISAANLSQCGATPAAAGAAGNAQGAVGPNLTDAEWIHSDGSYDAIVKQITTGVPKEESKSGIAMPPKGGSTITDDEVKAVAAYVYSLGHKKPT